MKRVLLLLITVGFTIASSAQKINIQNAINAIKSNDYAKAKQYLDKATTNESTKTNAKAWMLKGVLYQAIATPPQKGPDGKTSPFTAMVNGKPYMLDLAAANSLKAETPNAFIEATRAFGKVIKYSKRVNKNEIAPLGYNLIATSFNEGITHSKAKNNKAAFESYNNTKRILGSKMGKLVASSATGNPRLLAGLKQIDSLNSIQLASTAYMLGDNKVALPLIESAIDKGYASDNLFSMASEMYRTSGDNDKANKLLAAGLKMYPSSKRLLNEKINVLLKKSPEEAIKGLDEGIANDPTNADLHFNKGVFYDRLAEGAKTSAEESSFIQKSDAAYKKAIALNPKNAAYQSNRALVFYNQAKRLLDKAKKADDAQYKTLKAASDKALGKALPMLLETKTLLEGSANLSSTENQDTYKRTLMALKNVYLVKNELGKVKATQVLIDKLK